MKITWTIIVNVFWMVIRFFIPCNKWESKREVVRQKIRKINDELTEVTVELVQAKKNNQDAVVAALDMRRERLLASRASYQREYDYFQRLCHKEE